MLNILFGMHVTQNIHRAKLYRFVFACYLLTNVLYMHCGVFRLYINMYIVTARMYMTVHWLCVLRVSLSSCVALVLPGVPGALERALPEAG